eukprot:10284395-Alexandrium_andersonii.AAC.1
MSASLVGSEMCIRDSRCPYRACRATGSAEQSSTALELGSSRSSALLAAVSYTHLTLPTICSV